MSRTSPYTQHACALGPRLHHIYEGLYAAVHLLWGGNQVWGSHWACHLPDHGRARQSKCVGGALRHHHTATALCMTSLPPEPTTTDQNGGTHPPAHPCTGDPPQRAACAASGGSRGAAGAGHPDDAGRKVREPSRPDRRRNPHGSGAARGRVDCTLWRCARRTAGGPRGRCGFHTRIGMGVG
jgi:hypothetical protein